MRKILIAIASVLLLFLLSTCARAVEHPASFPSAPSFPQASLQPDRADWEKEWEIVLREARREGTIIVKYPGGPELRTAISQAFQEKYGIKVEGTTGKAAETAAKLQRERQAGIYSTDIFMGGANTITTSLHPLGMVEPIEPWLILPEVRDPRVWLQGKLPLVAYGKGFSMVKSPSNPMLINTKFVKPQETESYWDLLNPRFKGKIVIDNPIIAGSGLKWSVFILNFMERGEEFLRSLMKQEPVISTDRRLLSEWVAREKYWISLNPRPEMTEPFMELGFPLIYITPREGDYVSSGGGNITVINKAPHPNAAKLFTNWLLSREGSTLWSKSHLYQSSRLDVPTDHLKTWYIRIPGKRYFDGDSEEWEEHTVRHLELLQNIYAPILLK